MQGPHRAYSKHGPVLEGVSMFIQRLRNGTMVTSRLERAVGEDGHSTDSVRSQCHGHEMREIPTMTAWRAADPLSATRTGAAIGGSRIMETEV